MERESARSIGQAVSPPGNQHAHLLKVFWRGVALLTVILGLTAAPEYAEGAVGAVLIITASLLSSSLWISGRAPGLPLFPIYAVTHIWAFGLPLLYRHPFVAVFSGNDQLLAGCSVAGYLFVATFIWYAIVSRPLRARPAACLVFDESRGGLFFPLMLAGTLSLNIATLAGWIRFPEGFFSIVTAAMLALNALSAFVLSYRMGAGRLKPSQKAVFAMLLIALVIVSIFGLLLVNAMSLLVIAMSAYTLGAKKVPWRVATVALSVFAFLHYGKGDLRKKYWDPTGEEQFTLQPLQYFGFLNEWFDSSLQALQRGPEEEEIQSLQERASLMHLFLYVRSQTPETVPFLYGETYAPIPSLLVPRLFYPDKPRSHEGTYLLNIQYGFQTREDTQRTTIGFGLLNEAYANFGFFGLGMLALVTGTFYGVVSRWTRRMPLLSFRSLFAMLVASYAFQAEFAAGVYFAALFQSTIVLAMVALLFMRRKRLDELRGATFLE